MAETGTEDNPKSRKGDEEYPLLAEIARSYAGKLSVRQIQLQTGINRSTVARILKGRWVNPSFLIQWAAAFRRPTNPLLKAMGEPGRLPDPTIPIETATVEEVLGIELGRAAQAMGVTVSELDEALRTPEVAEALGYIARSKMSYTALMRLREEASKYHGVEEGLRRAGFVKPRNKKKVDETMEG